MADGGWGRGPRGKRDGTSSWGEVRDVRCGALFCEYLFSSRLLSVLALLWVLLRRRRYSTEGHTLFQVVVKSDCLGVFPPDGCRVVVVTWWWLCVADTRGSGETDVQTAAALVTVILVFPTLLLVLQVQKYYRLTAVPLLLRPPEDVPRVLLPGLLAFIVPPGRDGNTKQDGEMSISPTWKGGRRSDPIRKVSHTSFPLLPNVEGF